MFLTDVGPYRSDPLLFLDRTCAVEQEFINPDDDCPSDILMLCNGVKNCDDCSDEVYEHCMAYECSASKRWPFKHYRMYGIDFSRF